MYLYLLVMQGCCNFFSFLSVWDLYTWRLQVLCGNDILWHLLTHGLFEGKERSFTLAGFHGGSLTLFWWRFHIFFACHSTVKRFKGKMFTHFWTRTFLKKWAARKTVPLRKVVPCDNWWWSTWNHGLGCILRGTAATSSFEQWKNPWLFRV